MSAINDLMKEKKYVISKSLIVFLKGLDLSVNELLFILYYDNASNKEFNIENIKLDLRFTEEEVMLVLDSLMQKQLITLNIAKDNYNKNIEVVCLDNIYALIEDSINNTVSDSKTESIYDVFEKEFNRKLSSMEFEIINAWLDNNYSEELILGALKEAVYNGVNNFRYIDKILYEWHKNNFKTMNDVKAHLESRKNNKVDLDKTLFDYNWLEESDE